MGDDFRVEAGCNVEADATSEVGERDTGAEEATVMLPVGTSVGIPDETASTPIVGRDALGSTVHPPDAVGQAGAVVITVAAYWAELTPVGFSVAHCC